MLECKARKMFYSYQEFMPERMSLTDKYIVENQDDEIFYRLKTFNETIQSAIEAYIEENQIDDDNIFSDLVNNDIEEYENDRMGKVSCFISEFQRFSQKLPEQLFIIKSFNNLDSSKDKLYVQNGKLLVYKGRLCVKYKEFSPTEMK